MSEVDFEPVGPVTKTIPAVSPESKQYLFHPLTTAQAQAWKVAEIFHSKA